MVIRQKFSTQHSILILRDSEDIHLVATQTLREKLNLYFPSYIKRTLT